MKRLLGTLVLMLFMTQLFSGIANADKIAFVNLRQVLQESNIGKAAKTEIQSLIQAKKIVIQNKSNQLNNIIKELQNKSIKKTEKEKLQKDYQTKMQSLQQYQTKASEEIRNKEIEETNKVLKLAVKIIKNYAIKHNIDGVFEVSQGNVLYWNDKLDITKKIIDLMNKAKVNKK